MPTKMAFFDFHSFLSAPKISTTKHPPVPWSTFYQRSTHISKTFSPTTPLSTHQSIDLGELYNFVVGVEVNGWSLTYTFGRSFSSRASSQGRPQPSSQVRPEPSIWVRPEVKIGHFCRLILVYLTTSDFTFE